MSKEPTLTELIQRTREHLTRCHDEIDALLDKAGAPRRETCKVVKLYPDGVPISENAT